MNTPARRVWLHVGAPKTGTTQIQDLLFLNRASLREEHGILYPANGHDDHFMAALDLIGQQWGGLEERAVGAWGRLVEQANVHPGTVIISHEVFAGASREQAHAALDALEGEVHVVVSARDPHLQIPAEWQEGVKHRRRTTYAEFCQDLISPSPLLASTRWFWRVQDVPRVLDYWGSGLPPDRVHVLTVPGRDAPRDLLIERFLTLFGIDREWLTEASDRANTSLGAAETTVIRHLNELLPPQRLEGDVYRFHVRELLAHRTLAQRTGGAKITLPDFMSDWADTTAATWVGALESAGYDVVGDLAELTPTRAQTEWYDPDSAPAADQLDVTYAALEALLLDTGHLQADVDRLRAEHDRLRAELDRLRAGHEELRALRAEHEELRAEHEELVALRAESASLAQSPPPGPWMRAKQRFVAFGERNPMAGGLLRGWRLVRRR
ncbi:MAG: DUF1003 domain-containing protein [Actinomycetota bacterium]|nr:DUF1003 domain-containing protein [Actinomycetota bacterium]